MPIAIRRIDLMFFVPKRILERCPNGKELPVERLQDLVDVREDERESDRLTLDLDETGRVWFENRFQIVRHMRQFGVGQRDESPVFGPPRRCRSSSAFRARRRSSSCRSSGPSVFHASVTFLTIRSIRSAPNDWTGSE